MAVIDRIIRIGEGRERRRLEKVVTLTNDEFDAWMATQKPLYAQLFEQKTDSAAVAKPAMDSAVKQPVPNAQMKTRN